ncbi:MAG: non-ribosomal peptide synthetase, partial [Methylobacter sp.]
MNLQTLWQYVQEKGIQLTEKDGELVIHAPQGTMDAELLAQLKTHKPQLLVALQSGRFAGTLSQSSQQPTSVNKITPDMLPLVSLNQDEIDLIVGNMNEGGANIQDIYPLAPLQEGIFFHHLLDDKQGDTYLLRSVIRFTERNSLDEFLCGLQKVIDRHDILRTSIHWLGLPQPVQVVHRVAKLTIEELALTSSNDVLGQLLDYTDPRHITLDVQSAPLIKAVIAVDQSSGAWLLSLLNHHLVCDHMTLDGIVAEIRQMCAGQGDNLPPPVPYRNFIAQALAVPTAEHEAYFKTQLQDIDAPTSPFDILDTQVNSGQITEATLVLADGLAQAIRQSAQLYGVATAVLFHVAWAQVLARLTNREDVVFGTVLLGRLQGVGGAGQVLGLLINTLPIRISLSHRSVQEVVKTTYRQLGELLKHEQAPLSLAQRCSQVAPPLPLFTTLFNYRHNPQQAKHPEALDGMCVYQSEERTNYPIAISVNDLGQGFSLTAQCIDAVDPTRIVSYLNHAMTELVDALAKTPDYPMSGLDMLPESERRQLLLGFNATASDYPQNCCIQQLFEQQVRQTPDAPALVHQDQVLSYSQLNGYANQAAHRLIGLGIRPDDRVAICMERSLEMVVALLGILKAGGAYVPLEPGYPKERLAYMLADSKPIAVFTQQEGQGNLPTQAELGMPILLIDVSGEQSQGMPGQYPNPSVMALNSQQLAYIIYTSGSTGYPKGVMVEHRSVINLWTGLENTAFRDFPQNSRMGLNAALVFDASVQAIVQLLSGRCVVVIPAEIRADIPAFLAFIGKEKINALDCTPSQLELMLSAGLFDKTNHCLEKVLVGGEAIGNATWCLLKNATAIDFYNVYGPTECTVDATIAHVNTAGNKSQIGSPLVNTQCYILDAYLRPVPIGVSGEIYLGGAGVARGYLDRPGLTAGRFIPNPFRQAGDAQAPRLYRTGDLGRWRPDGTVDYLG